MITLSGHHEIQPGPEAADAAIAIRVGKSCVRGDVRVLPMITGTENASHRGKRFLWRPGRRALAITATPGAAAC